MRLIYKLLILLLGCGLSQSNSAQFDVASVNVSPVPAVHRAFTFDERGVDFGNITMETIVETAFNLEAYQIRALPWFHDNRYDIHAKAPAGATRSQVRDMLKTLLAERFQMKSHTEEKESNIYALGVGKGGPKIEVAAAEPGLPALDHKQVFQRIASSSGPQYIFREPGRMVFEAKKITMVELARFLMSYVDFPVLDTTGLKDAYEVSLEVPGGTNYKSRPAAIARDSISDPAGEVSVVSSIRKLGLVLDRRKAPLPTLVIDSMNPTPTEN
jgi:uncharacterized protein (TIGR03435 family)